MIDFCWQSLWDFAKEHQALTTAGFTSLAFSAFWLFRYLLGHKMYRLTCWRLTDDEGNQLKRIDLHDWQPITETHMDRTETRIRCSRCLSMRTATSMGMVYNWSI